MNMDLLTIYIQYIRVTLQKILQGKGTWYITIFHALFGFNADGKKRAGMNEKLSCPHTTNNYTHILFLPL